MESIINYKNNRGCTILHMAIQHDNTELINLILKTGIDVNIQDNEGKTALFNAIFTDNTELVYRLITEHGADISIKNNDGNTVLHCAVKYNQVKIMEILLSLLKKKLSHQYHYQLKIHMRYSYIQMKLENLMYLLM